MLLTIEKVIFLKSVDIFSEISEDSLVDVAAAMIETQVEEGQAIFKKDDPGSAMYIITSGKVRLHDEEKVNVTLGERQVFGLLAALDPEPRVVSATATELTHMFKITGNTMYTLMAENIEFAQGVIHVLCKRLRQSQRK